MKGGIPDDCNAWTKTGIVECLGTPDEHTDTFYRHGDWGIEEHNEHEFEVYAIVEGKPILVKEGFTTFRECTEFIRGSIASKRLETDVDEKDPECQTPKEEVKMVIKPFRMMMEDIMKANGMMADSDDDLDVDPGDVELYPRSDRFKREEIIESRPFGGDGASTDFVVAPRSKNMMGVNYGGSPSGDVNGVDVGYGYPSHRNKHPKVIKDSGSRGLTDGPENPTRSLAGTSTDLDSTYTGVDVNPDEKRRKEILGEAALNPLPEGEEVEGFDYKVKKERPNIYPTRTERQNKYYEGEKPTYVSGNGLQAAQNYLVDALSEVLPEEVLVGTMRNPQALFDVIKEQGPNGEIAKQLRGFLANNPSFSAAWNDLTTGQKLVPGGGFTDTGASESGYYNTKLGSIQTSPLSTSQRKTGTHEQKSYAPNPTQYGSPENLIDELRTLGRDSNTYKFIRNMMDEDAASEIGSSKYIVPKEGGGSTYLMRQFINDNFDRINTGIRGKSRELLAGAEKKDPNLTNTGVVDDTADYSSSPENSDQPPVNSSSSGPALAGRNTWYPDSEWHTNADLTHETKNLMDAIYRLSREAFPNDRGGPTDSFFQIRNHGKGDDKESSVQWKNQAQVAQEAQDKFNRSKRGKTLNEIYAMPRETPEQIQAYNDALNAFYAAEDEKLSGKEAKAAAKREEKEQEEQDRHEANKLATEQKLQDKKEAEGKIISEKNDVSEEYDRLIAEGARSWAQHGLDKKRRKKNGEPQTPHGVEYYADIYRTKYPRSNYKTMESLKELEAQLKADAENSRTKYTGKPGEIGQPRADRPTLPGKQKMEVFRMGEESEDDFDDDRVPSFRDLVKAETDKVDATRGLPTGYRYKPETRVFRDLYRTTILDGKDDISTVMAKVKN